MPIAFSFSPLRVGYVPQLPWAANGMFCLPLQAQMRDLAGFVETRQQLLTLKPNHRMNWIGFAVAHHLNSKYMFMVH